MSSRRSRRLAMAATILLFSSIPIAYAEPEVPAAAKATGDLWEVTSQMSMEGMALPAQKPLKVCMPKNSTEPPGGADERMKCTNSDFKRDGAKATWKTVCAGPPAVTGDGEITYDGTTSYAGAIKFTSDEGNMTIKLSGRRIDDCVLTKK